MAFRMPGFPPPGKNGCGKGKMVGKGQHGPLPPAGPPQSQRLAPQAKARPRQGGQPATPNFFGAASRKRAMELLGETQPKALRNMYGLRGMQAGAAPTSMPPPMSAPSARSRKADADSAPAPKPIPEPETPPLLRIELPDDEQHVASGLPCEPPVVHFSKALKASMLLGNASTILADLVEDIEADVELRHDPDWKEYKQLGKAILANGGEENSLCVAICKSQDCWGVGVGGKWKDRESVAKLALCVALASQASPDFANKWMAFMDFALSGAIPSADNAGPSPAHDWAAPVTKRKKTAKPVDDDDDVIEKTPSPHAKGALPRDAPIWIRLDGEHPEKLNGVGSDEVLVVSTEGNKRKGLYTQSDAALAAFLSNPATDIEYIDDANWEHFRSVGRALKAIANTEECMCIAVCSSLDVWGVGVGMKGKSRYGACKAALATSIALQKLDHTDELPEAIDDLSQIKEFIKEAQEKRN